jgi:hypothetical protein
MRNITAVTVTSRNLPVKVAAEWVGPRAATCRTPKGSSVRACYGFLNPICFAIAASSILTGRSLGSVQFLKRRGTTA